MIPSETEPICLVSFEIARIRLGGGPDSRPGFWRAYREELALNQQTQFRNEHVRICLNYVQPLLEKPVGPVYFRNNRLTPERVVGNHSKNPSLRLDH